MPRPRSAMEVFYVIEVRPQSIDDGPFVSKAGTANIPATRLGLGGI